MSNGKLVGAIVVLVVIFVVASFWGYYNLKGKYELQLTGEKQAVQTLAYEKELLTKNNQILQGEVAKLNETLEELHGFDLPLTKMEQALGLAEEEKPLDRVRLPFRLNEVAAENQVLAFFNYLDQQAYVQEQTQGVKTYAIFVKNVNTLGLGYPNVPDETKSFFEMMKNLSFFFRSVGKDNVLLAQSVLNNEHDIMEPVMAAFYGWFTADNPQLRGRPDLKTMYEYSDYLLNSLGGRAYLMRRSAKVRLLTMYYCVLTVDRANDQNMNYNGIDLRLYLDTLQRDIQTQLGLINRDEYISKLETLKTKYQR